MMHVFRAVSIVQLGLMAFVLIMVYMHTGAPAQAQSPLFAEENPCYDDGWENKYQMSDLYCIPLQGTPDYRDVNGYAVMRPVMSPFGVDVDRHGYHQYQLEFVIEGLPDPSEIGEYEQYIAWVTTPQFYPVKKLGEVGNGSTVSGEVAFNMFTVFVSAEPAGTHTERKGTLVLRGMSPSSRMEGHDLLQVAPLALMGQDEHTHSMHDESEEPLWTMPPMHPNVSMLPGMMHIKPEVNPYSIPDSVKRSLPDAEQRKRVFLRDGDTFTLRANTVRRQILGYDLAMYGFNKQYPGPLLEVNKGDEVQINFVNEVNLPSAIHWHGLRLNYRHDGVPGLTQELVQPGASHRYVLNFPDPGLYWYHPHFREDIKMDLGLYANILVRSDDPQYFNPVHREEIVVLDDLLLDEKGVVPYGEESSNYMMMGRFGNTFLLNGITDYKLSVKLGEVIRFYLTNTSNTRTYNVSIGEQPMKLVASDVGRFEKEVWVDNVIIATAERYMVEVHFDAPGRIPILNKVQAIHHRKGLFFPEVDTLGFIDVQDVSVENGIPSFKKLRENEEVIKEFASIKAYYNTPVDKELVVKLETENLPAVVQQLMRFDYVYFNPVEWSGTMPMMNWASSGEEIQWVLEDPETGHKNMDIDWAFRVGDRVKIKLTNERDAFHAMQHPIHIHGQRFAVLKRNGVRNENLVWKDTMIVPAGSTAEILLEISNPGKWMMHCHIAEHIDSGMMFVFDVEE
ncbi:MAG: multicopper oxidase family protein [Rhodothermaceae bacterium]|nr:multicopper oxidase family protein [Rhodothermaceae bacterium]